MLKNLQLKKLGIAVQGYGERENRKKNTNIIFSTINFINWCDRVTSNKCLIMT